MKEVKVDSAAEDREVGSAVPAKAAATEETSNGCAAKRAAFHHALQRLRRHAD